MISGPRRAPGADVRESNLSGHREPWPQPTVITSKGKPEMGRTLGLVLRRSTMTQDHKTIIPHSLIPRRECMLELPKQPSPEAGNPVSGRTSRMFLDAFLAQIRCPLKIKRATGLHRPRAIGRGPDSPGRPIGEIRGNFHFQMGRT